jgi:hypothetical protein
MLHASRLHSPTLVAAAPAASLPVESAAMTSGGAYGWVKASPRVVVVPVGTNRLSRPAEKSMMTAFLCLLPYTSTSITLPGLRSCTKQVGKCQGG